MPTSGVTTPNATGSSAARAELLHARLAAAKTSHYATRESGDTVELVERPDGGFTFVLVDGQGHGMPAKLLSMQLSAKAVSLIKEGVRDGVVARAVGDYLFAFRGGRVSATLDLLSLDLHAGSVLLTRNSDGAGIVRAGGEWAALPCASGPIGTRRHGRPAVSHHDLTPGLVVVLYTDGIARAGERYGAVLDPIAALAELDEAATAQELADGLLTAAVAADHGRPADDMTAVALTVSARDEATVVRRLAADIPLVLRRRDG